MRRRPSAHPRTATRRIPARTFLAVLVLTVGLLASACSSGDTTGTGDTDARSGGVDGSTGDPAAPDDADDPAPVPDPFDGDVDDFYRVPELPEDGRPGDLIRIQEIDAAPGETAVRIMYLTEDRTGTIRAATGTIHHPDGDAPEDGWPVIADAHGTTGIVAACAPSRLGLVPADHGMEAVRVMADYIGLGPEGERHPYLSKTAEANAVIDALHATRGLLGDDMGRRWVLVGHSQGGHAALAGAELAGERAPDLELLGAVASAPGAQFQEVHGDELQLRIITSLIMMGSESEWPELDPETYFAADRLETVEEIITTNCLDEIVPAMIPLAASSDLFAVDPFTDDDARAFMAENDPLPEPVDVPILVTGAGADIIVVPRRVEALRDRLCAIGQQTEYRWYEDADHGTLPAIAGDDIDAWVQARFAGESAGDDC